MTTIVIDKTGLEALFPEGSDIRLKLAESAVSAFCDKMTKQERFGHKLSLRLETLYKEASENATKLFFERDPSSTWKMRPTQELQDIIRVRAMVMIEQHINEEITRQIEIFKSDMARRVESAVESEVVAMVRRRIKDAVETAVRAA